MVLNYWLYMGVWYLYWFNLVEKITHGGAMSDRAKEIISDEEIERVHANANFGGMAKRDVVNLGVLKCASGYYQGHTSTQIIQEHELIDGKYKLTPKGKAYLWAAFGDGTF